MKYMGSKARHAKELLPIILRDRKEGQWYVEPFVGGANMIDKVDGNRIGADLNPYLIIALKGIRDNSHLIPDLITEDDYKNYQSTKNSSDWLCGFVSFAMSFGGKFFGGYRRDKVGQKGCVDNMRNQTRMAKNSALKQQPLLQTVKLECCGYQDLEIPSQSIIYCDPPYANTTGYKDKFNHAEFWQWCRDKCKQGHKVFISEYGAPDDFVCVWEKKVGVSVAKGGAHKKATEKLFVHESQVDTCNDIGVI